MSYKKAMKWAKKHPRGIKQLFNGFSTLDKNERRRSPQESAAYLDRLFAMPEDERNKAIEKRQSEWDEETKRLLSINPNLKIID